MKDCVVCNISKNFVDFYKDQRNKDGLKSKCKDCIKEYTKNNYVKKGYKEGLIKSDKDNTYQQNYHKMYPDYRKNYMMERRNSDHLFKISCNIRNLIKNASKRGYTKKSKRTLDILGITFEKFKMYIELQFDGKMTWENYGSYLEIDHIKPIKLSQSEEDIILLNHYTNLRPLSKSENRRKGSEYK